MGQGQQNELAALVASLEEQLDRGEIDTAVAPEQRGRLVELCKRSAPDGLVRLEGLTLAVELSLIAFDLDTAGALLAPYLTETSGADFRSKRLEKTQEDYPLASAVLLSTSADYLFRKRAYKAAHKAAALADGWFNSMAIAARRVAPEKMQQMLPIVIPRRLWNWSRWARISWRDTGKPEGPERHLVSLFRELETARQYIPRARAYSIEAFALDFWAALDWSRGRVTDAQAKIYRALFLHGTGEFTDTVRFAYALFTAGKIEASLVTPGDCRKAVELLERSEDLFASFRGHAGGAPRTPTEPDGHPLSPRPTIQKAEVYIRAGQIDEATRILGLLEKSNKLGEGVHKAEAALARGWIHEREKNWKQACACADELLAVIAEFAEPPPRLTADAYLQRGRSKTHLGDVDGAIRDLKTALQCATENSRARTRAAAHLELANAYLIKGDEDEAKIEWDTATGLVDQFPSAYLISRREEIDRKFANLRWVFRIETTNFKEAKHEFEFQFFDRLVKRQGSMQKAAKAAKVARTTVFHILKTRQGK